MTLIMLNLPSQTTARLKAGVGSLFLPLFGLTSSSERLAEQAGDSVVSRKELLRQNEALRRENQQFRLQLMQAEQMGRENDRLRQLFGWQQQRRWQLKLARVVLRDPANWWRTVQPGQPRRPAGQHAGADYGRIGGADRIRQPHSFASCACGRSQLPGVGSGPEQHS